ncbi:MAG: DUF2249 domain-containing protein [Rubrivivax sp.]|nr:DUF2249 domain-containing protein [Rubrivivax sp.]
MTIAAELIDVRIVPPPRRHPLIFGTFDTLELGEGFEIVNDHDPAPLRAHFERTRPGQYVWRYLETGPLRWHVRIDRVASGPVVGSPGECHACSCHGA